MNKKCYPTYDDLVLYEDKILEGYLSKHCGFPFIPTYTYNDEKEALKGATHFNYPIISKVVPGSGSMGVEMINTKEACCSVIKKAFSPAGRKTHIRYFNQKNYVYFQDFIPNDGYDIRIIVIGDLIFGYYRRSLEGDFRASGFGMVEKRELPKEAIQIARNVYDHLNSTMLVIDLLYGTDEKKYFIIEISPLCRVDTSEQLHVNGIPGVYVLKKDGSYRFERGRFWIHELALKEFLKNILLNVKNRGTSKMKIGVVGSSQKKMKKEFQYILSI